MTTDEFIEKIKNLKEGEWCGCFDWDDDVDTTGWHNVKDKLPNKDGKYLVCGIGNNYYPTVVCDFNHDSVKLKWYIEEDDGFREIEVTHWMELPEPPHVQ